MDVELPEQEPIDYLALLKSTPHEVWKDFLRDVLLKAAKELPPPKKPFPKNVTKAELIVFLEVSNKSG